MSASNPFHAQHTMTMHASLFTANAGHEAGMEEKEMQKEDVEKGRGDKSEVLEKR